MYALLPDTDAAVVAFIKNHPSLSALHGGRVGTKLPAGTASVVRVSSLGGSQTFPWAATQEFQAEWWGGDQGQASLLCRTGEAAIYDISGPVTGGWIRGVQVLLTRLWSPDETTGRARYITQFRINVFPEGS